MSSAEHALKVLLGVCACHGIGRGLRRAGTLLLVLGALLSGAGPALAAAAKPAIQYTPSSYVFTVGTAILPVAPISSGGPVVSWAVKPVLPGGLVFDAATGILTGTPIVASPATVYTVKAFNASGSASASLTLKVNDLPPAIAYVPSSYVLFQNTAAPVIAPSSTGGMVLSFRIAPVLPKGLRFDTKTGQITGKPMYASPLTSYTVTATNLAGTDTAGLAISVVYAAPSISYSPSTGVFQRGVAISPLVPVNTGGKATAYSVSPALPAGLGLNPDTGIISGIPTAATDTAAYTVTATNATGSSTATLTLAVVDGAPTSLSYATNPAVYTKGVAIAPNSPTVGGGTATAFSVSPALPAGLTLNTTTGVVSGTPAATAAQASYTVTASNLSGSTSVGLVITVNEGAPSGLTYAANPAVYTKGVAITPNAPSSGGGAATAYSVSPALPSGLSLNTSTGVVTGTPTVAAAQATYTVTASNGGGSTTVGLVITVQDAAPSGLTYATNPATYTKGVVITPNTPSSGGGAATAYSVSPALPSGLSLNTSTGVVSGTPTVAAAQATYTVTAGNGGGSTTVGLVITVNDAAPSGLTYATNPATYTKGVAITPNTPSSGGGAVTTYSVSPALPDGLSLNTSTGVVSGTPTVAAAQATYTVTAGNGGGSTTVGLVITVNDAAPSGLTYATNPAVYTKGVAITPNTPSSGGGAATTYSVSPALPDGLSLNTSTGVVSGTPTVVAAQATYTVTASSGGGSTTVGLVLTVNDVAPSGLSYASNPVTYIKGVSNVSNSPTYGGGTPTSYSVSPALPAGLTLNTSTGVITGTPTAVAAQATYTVTASNSGGSANVYLYLTVNDVAPSELAYSANPAAYTLGTAITPNTPSNVGGTVVSYSVSPGLPDGLSLNTGTGVITGTPAALVVLETTYTITATNSGGTTSVGLKLTVKDVPPSGLTYATNPATYTVGTAITANSPSSSGGAVTKYLVSPMLPAGLLISKATGAITGTPTTVSAMATYTVSAENSGGSTSAGLQIAINDVPPSGLTYTNLTANYTRGIMIIPNSPSSSGGTVVSYSVSPALPDGLTLNTSTGVISGTPTALVVTQTTYTVTATNSGGSTTAALKITVKDAAPQISLDSYSYTFTRNLAITPITPTNTGGVVATWSVTPALPAGLSQDSGTGVISGTPTAAQALTGYNISASNSGGTSGLEFDITVSEGAPSGLTYDTSTATYTKGVAIASNYPDSEGGAPTSYSVSPALPSGLTLNTSTGVITGTPGAVAAQASYTVTARNSAGSTTAVLSITVNDAQPSIAFASSSYSFTTGLAIAPLAPASTGGEVVTWAIAPALPAGLSFSTTTGTISGTPTTITASASYQVTATNSGGEDTASAMIAVNPPAPTISVQPSNQGVTLGATASFGVAASGTGSLSYQWYREGEPIEGATSATYVTPATVQADNGARFSVVVSDAYGGSITSQKAVLTLIGLHFAPAGMMTTARDRLQAALLPNGMVLLAGGAGTASIPVTAELFDPATGLCTTTGDPLVGRIGGTATTLANGQVLLVGGMNAGGYLDSAELYNPATGEFSATGTMATKPTAHTATLLANGKVLIAGGWGNTEGAYAVAQLYDPQTGVFETTGTMTEARYWHTATLLANGKVLMVGGSGNPTGDHTSAELYDPDSGQFTAVSSHLGAGRGGHTATLLPSGKVLIAGGAVYGTLASTELFDPDTGLFTPAGAMTEARALHTATLLANGKVLLAAGEGNNSICLASADLYDPVADVCTAAGSLGAARHYHTATLLPNGTVLFAGGSGPDPLASTELYDPQDFTATGSLAVARRNLTATALTSGKVLLAGGFNGIGSRAEADLYDPAEGRCTATGALAQIRCLHSATLLPDGTVLVAGGNDNIGPIASAERYNPSSGQFTATGSMLIGRQFHGATLLANGLVLISGGDGSDQHVQTTAELYDPATGAFAATGPMHYPRQQHAAVRLASGKVLVAGGSNNSMVLAAAELYDPADKTFSPTGSLVVERRMAAAVLLPDGRVLLAGGAKANSVILASAELYDPTTGTFSATGTMATARIGHTATLLPSGKVLVAGGETLTEWLASAELYDPATGTFAPVGSMAAPRLLHAAALLPTGKVLVAGGDGAEGYMATAELYQ